MSLLPKMTLKKKETIFADKIINEYSTIISKYNVKEKIESASSASDSYDNYSEKEKRGF
jgi:hypothetical protein